MTTSLVAVEHDFDQETLDDFASLRSMRLSLAQEQYANAEATVNELIKRGLIVDGDRAAYVKELRTELALKIGMLEIRTHQPTLVHFDEIELYVDALKS